MWTAVLQSVRDPATPNDTLDVDVRYTNSVTNKIIIKGYNLHAAHFSTVRDFRVLITNELNLLNSFDTFTQQLTAVVGQQITPV